jgi:tRNA 2-selenouridine synthase
LTLCVLAGATGTGKTRLLTALEAQGEQVIDLEGFAGHRGSLIGEVPGVTQPTQKWFDSMVFDRLRRFDPSRVVWVEAESKKIGNIQIPPALHDAMRLVTPIVVTAPMTERVKLWHEDYSHLAADPVGMVQRLEPLKPLIGNEELATWRDLAARRAVDELFERVMTNHYDPCYERSSKHGITKQAKADHLPLTGLDPASLATAARDLIARFSSV